MNKLLIICGPTATGKTDLAINLSQKFPSEIISADSRQLYQGMDIGTGKNNPPGATKSLSHLLIHHHQLTTIDTAKTKIWGYDLVSPNQDFSIAQYVRIATIIARDISSRSKLPIVVGGSGLYLNALTSNINTITIPLNRSLRQQLRNSSTSHLTKLLSQLDPDKLKSMNHSDRHNPRRLIRAIEVARYYQDHPSIATPSNNLSTWDQLWIGLTAPKPILKQKIIKNIKSRATAKFSQEIKSLDQNKFDWHSQSASSTGYKPWKAYMQKQITRQSALDQWITTEIQYMNRQMTWFNKQSQINWFDLTNSDHLLSIERAIEDWYSNS